MLFNDQSRAPVCDSDSAKQSALKTSFDACGRPYTATHDDDDDNVGATRALLTLHV